MSYKTVKFGLVLDGVRRGLGFDPDNTTPTANERVRDAEVIDRMMEIAWQACLWPQLLIVSHRYYRPDWDNTETYAIGEEVWRESGDFAHYCRAKTNHSGQDPATDTTETNWEIDPADFIPNVEFQQWWESSEIDGFDLNEVATTCDPLTNLNPGFIRNVKVWEQSLVMPPEAPESVYLRFRPTRPRFGGAVWAVGTAYATNDLVYLASTKESYIALQPSTGKSPDSETSYWAPVGFPEFLQRYCTWAAVAEMQAEDSGAYKTKAQANDELDRLIDVHGPRAGERNRVTIRRYRRG